MNYLITSKRAVSRAAAIICTLCAAGVAGADFQGIASDTLDKGVGIGTRYRVYVDIHAGDKVAVVFGGTFTPIMVSTLGGIAIFQMQDLQKWPKSVSDAVFGFSTSLVDLSLLGGRSSNLLIVNLEQDDFTVPGPRNLRGLNPFSTPQSRPLKSGIPVGNILTYSITDPFAIDDPIVIPAPGVLALLTLAGVVTRRRRS